MAGIPLCKAETLKFIHRPQVRPFELGFQHDELRQVKVQQGSYNCEQKYGYRFAPNPQPLWYYNPKIRTFAKNLKVARIPVALAKSPYYINCELVN
jgi:hypothetical protein